MFVPLLGLLGLVPPLSGPDATPRPSIWRLSDRISQQGRGIGARPGVAAEEVTRRNAFVSRLKQSLATREVFPAERSAGMTEAKAAAEAKAMAQAKATAEAKAAAQAKGAAEAKAAA